MSWKDILKEELHPFIRFISNDSVDMDADFDIKRMCRAGKEHLSKGLYNLNLKNNEIFDAYALQRFGDYTWLGMYSDEPATDKEKKDAKAIENLITESKRICSLTTGPEERVVQGPPTVAEYLYEEDEYDPDSLFM